MAKDLYDWQAKGFSEIYEHTRESAAISAISAKAPDLLVVDAQAPCMAQMAFLHRARLLAPQMRVILLTSQKDFSVAQAAFDLRVDALLVWSELDAEIFSSRVDRVVSELDEMIHRRGIVKRQLFRDILKGKIPTEEESEKYFELPVKHPQYVMIRINRDRMATQTIRPAEHRDIPVPPNPFTVPNSFMTEHLFVFLTVMLSSVLIRLLSSKQQMKLEYEQLKTEKLQNSYNALMGQINPHFFFNSLNGLNALIQSGEKQQTLAYLDELSNVFRYILQSNKKELVTLAEELQFVKAYTYLLSVRYEGKLFFSIQADTPYLLWYLPILSVLPLIENAVKHNVISKQYPLQIDIYTTHEDKLIISNKIHPKSEDSKGSGIGLKNLWGRYRMLTGKDIQISNRKEYFKVTLPLLNKPIHS